MTYHPSLIEDSTPPRTLSEVTRGNGAMCGSAFIDQNMSLLLRSKLSDGDIPSCMFEMMMDTFIETIKVRITFSALQQVDQFELTPIIAKLS